MLGVKISGLPVDPAISGNEKIPVSENGVTRFITINQLAAFILSTAPPISEQGLTTEDGQTLLSEDGQTLISE